MANEKNDNKKAKRTTVKHSIGKTLLTCLIPIIIIGTIGIILFISFNARSIITEISLMDLQAESDSNAKTLGNEFQLMTAKFDQYCDTLESVSFADHDAMLKYIEPTTDFKSIENTGLYIGFSDDTYISADHKVRSADWKPTQRGWYSVGKDQQTFVCTDPYIAASTHQVCVTYCRSIDFYNGEFGVAAVDVYLTQLQEDVNSLTPMKTGHSIVLADNNIISYIDSEQNGKTYEEAADQYINDIKSYIDSDSNEIIKLKEPASNVNYYICSSDIPGTPWTLISAVAVNDVMNSANIFMLLSMIVMLILIIVIVLVILLTVKAVITKPVAGLSDSILKISDGDFTVKMPKDNGDEIGFISREMNNFVSIMNTAISSVQDKSEKLKEEAELSRNTSDKMSTAAYDQSESMKQIQTTMDDITNAVSGLAENATNLANAVSDLTENGSQTNDVMLSLVDQAKIGQEDMSAVQDNMMKVTASMGEMNEVVTTVDESAKQITEIVELINSISMQTNLLSLNASIEAARAGEAGKGFAVVADEIGKLAQNSQSAAKEIGDIINKITDLISDLAEKSQQNTASINESGNAVEKAGSSFNLIYDDLNSAAETMKRMIGMMGEVNDIAASVAAISEEQSASSEEITATIYTLTESAQQIAEDSKEVKKSANSVSESALSINSELDKFKI